jgi:hypothetical protein
MIVLVTLLLTTAFAQVDTTTTPAHLRQAQQLVDNLRGASENVYGGGKRHIDWSVDHCAARTVCSSFITLLLQHSYGWNADDIQKMTGSTDPQAGDYHDAIVDHSGFKRIIHAAALRPGDVIAIKYTDHHISRNGVEDTGHIMLVDEPAVPIDSADPIVDGTHQYTVTIIDPARPDMDPPTRAIVGVVNTPVGSAKASSVSTRTIRTESSATPGATRQNRSITPVRTGTLSPAG